MVEKMQAIQTAPRPVAPTELDRQVHDTMARWYALQETNDRLTAQIAQQEQQITRLLHENEFQVKRNGELEHRLSYFMRHSTEVATRLADVRKVMDMASDTINQTLEDAKRAGYRPPPPGTPREETNQDNGEPVPKFLTALATELAKAPADERKKDIAE